MSTTSTDHVLVTRVVRANSNGDVVLATAAGEPLYVPADVLTAAVAARNVDQDESLRSIARHPSAAYRHAPVRTEAPVRPSLRLVDGGDCS